MAAEEAAKIRNSLPCAYKGFCSTAKQIARVAAVTARTTLILSNAAFALHAALGLHLGHMTACSRNVFGFYFSLGNLRQSRAKCLWQEGKRILTLP